MLSVLLYPCSTVKSTAEWACKPNSVPQLAVKASSCDELRGDHLSRMPITRHLKRPTRSFGRATRGQKKPPGLPLAWSCSRWGLPSRSSHPDRWWSLTPPLHSYDARNASQNEAFLAPRLAFCCTMPSGCPAWELPSIVLYGVRTFLEMANRRRFRRPTSQSPGPLKPNHNIGDMRCQKLT